MGINYVSIFGTKNCDKKYCQELKPKIPNNIGLIHLLFLLSSLRDSQAVANRERGEGRKDGEKYKLLLGKITRQ